VITELLEQFGQGGRCGLEVAGFRYFSSFLVADARSAFVLETVGRRWAVEQIRGARSISNGLTLSSFAGDGDPLRTRIARASARRSCTERAGARARDVRDLMKALRDHGHDGLRYGLVNGAMGGPCMHGGGVLAASQTVASWVSDLREGATRHFATGTAAPCTAIFKPVRVDTPVDVGAPTDVADEHSLWWRHERLHRAVMRDPERLLARYVEERDAAEQRFVDEDVAPTLAFAETDQLLARWTADVGAQRAIDRRPRWAQRYWSARGRAARLAPIG
jgi:dipeptidase